MYDSLPQVAQLQEGEASRDKAISARLLLHPNSTDSKSEAADVPPTITKMCELTNTREVVHLTHRADTQQVVQAFVIGFRLVWSTKNSIKPRFLKWQRSTRLLLAWQSEPAAPPWCVDQVNSFLPSRCSYREVSFLSPLCSLCTNSLSQTHDLSLSLP